MVSSAAAVFVVATPLLWLGFDLPPPILLARYGLPPHPICNPERSSIVAALYPEEGSKDLYFVALESLSAYLTPLGRFYWRLAENGRL